MTMTNKLAAAGYDFNDFNDLVLDQLQDMLAWVPAGEVVVEASRDKVRVNGQPQWVKIEVITATWDGSAHGWAYLTRSEALQVAAALVQSVVDQDVFEFEQNSNDEEDEED